MPSPGHQRYQDSIRVWIESCGDQPGVAETLYFYRDTLLVLWNLDLEPARPVLEQCWAENPRGGSPWDPVVKLRALLLAVLVGQPSLNKWADDLAGNRILRVLAGIEMDRDRMLREGRAPERVPLRPGVGTFYDFLHHLHDGASIARMPVLRVARVGAWSFEAPQATHFRLRNHPKTPQAVRLHVSRRNPVANPADWNAHHLRELDCGVRDSQSRCISFHRFSNPSLAFENGIPHGALP